MTDTDYDPASRDDTTEPGKSKPQSAPDEAAGQAKKNVEQDAEQDAEVKAGEETRKKRRPLIVTIGAGIVGLLIIAGVYYWFTTRNLESTDDAYTDGRAITIAAQVAGEVISLDVTDNQFVK